MAQPGKFVANVVRRTWDLSEYEAKAQEKARAEGGDAEADARRRNRERAAQALVVRAPLKHREKEVQLETRLGKRSVVSSTAPLSARGGYYCDICECMLKDSITYLDHINGKKHQRALGMTLRAERSTLGDVKAKLEDAKRKQDELSSGSELEQRLARFQDEVEADKRERREQRRAEESRRLEAAARAEQAEAAFTLGATSSEARKRKKNTDTQRDGAVEEEEAERDNKKARAGAAASSTAAASAVDAEPAEDEEARLMREMMGFSSGFAKGKNK